MVFEIKNQCLGDGRKNGEQILRQRDPNYPTWSKRKDNEIFLQYHQTC